MSELRSVAGLDGDSVNVGGCNLAVQSMESG